MANMHFLARAELQSLVACLERRGYRCVGPLLRDGAIVYDEINHVDQLPKGVHDQQVPGSYRIIQDDNPRLFAWANGPQAIKPQLFKSTEVLWRVERDEAGQLQFVPAQTQVEPVAIFGARSCDLAAMAIQDQVFLHSEHVDPYYQQARESLFTVAVNCSDPAETCFCASTGDGPHADVDAAYDLILTELDDGYLIDAGSDKGQEVLACLPLAAATDHQFFEAGQQRMHARQAQQRALPTPMLAKTLMQKLDHPRWHEVAERCLSCGNCTLVCPTCFCHKEEENPGLNGQASEHSRAWDSCFTEGHSYIHGAVLRKDTAARYRQWLTHKLATWQDQFGSSGCVGCGRCLTWCPAGIDMTEEANAICGDDHA